MEHVQNLTLQSFLNVLNDTFVVDFIRFILTDLQVSCSHQVGNTRTLLQRLLNALICTVCLMVILVDFRKMTNSEQVFVFFTLVSVYPA